MTPGLRFRFTFYGTTATVTGDCSLRYSHLRAVPGTGSARIEFGGLSIGPTACAVGTDPGGPPSGDLFVHREGRALYLGTGYVGWGFREVE